MEGTFAFSPPTVYILLTHVCRFKMIYLIHNLRSLCPYCYASKERAQLYRCSQRVGCLGRVVTMAISLQQTYHQQKEAYSQRTKKDGFCLVDQDLKQAELCKRIMHTAVHTQIYAHSICMQISHIHAIETHMTIHPILHMFPHHPHLQAHTHHKHTHTTTSTHTPPQAHTTTSTHTSTHTTTSTHITTTTTTHTQRVYRYNPSSTLVVRTRTITRRTTNPSTNLTKRKMGYAQEVSG